MVIIIPIHVGDRGLIFIIFWLDNLLGTIIALVCCCAVKKQTNKQTNKFRVRFRVRVRLGLGLVLLLGLG